MEETSATSPQDESLSERPAFATFEDCRGPIEQLCRDKLKAALEDANFVVGSAECSEFTTELCDQLTAQLADIGRGKFKFTVTCNVLPKSNQAAFSTHSSCLWDASTDGSCSVSWDNASMSCSVIVMGMAV